MRTLLISGSFGLLISASAFAQGTFQDLDFEEATIPPGTQYSVSVADALPGWTVDYGSTPQTQILYNDQSTGGTLAVLLAKGTSYPPLDGNFSIELYGGGDGNGNREDVSISQTGQIPFATQSLLFEGGWFSGGPGPDVSIGNDNLTLFPVGGGFYGANISAWAGQTEKLTFLVPGGYGPYFFDDISFSSGAVPEPNPLALIGIGGVLFSAYRRFAPQRKLERSLDS